MICRALIASLLFLLLPPQAHAQQAVKQSGLVTPGHAARWSTNGVISDAGGAAGSTKQGAGYLTELGITNTGTPVCVNDALINAAGGYHQLCLGANGLGAGLITYNAYGGATPLPLDFIINGVTFQLPPASGTVITSNAVFPEDAPYNAVGNGVTDDSSALDAACTAAANSAIPMILQNKYLFAASKTLGCNIVFRPGAYITPNTGITVTATGWVDGPPMQWLFKGAGTVTLTGTSWVSIAWWGAYDAALAGTDAGPAIRASKGAYITQFWPSSSFPYLIKTTDGSSAPYPSTTVPGVLYSQLSGLTIDGYGATVEMSGTGCTTLPAGYSNDCRRTETLFFDRTPGVVVRGLTIKGDSTLTASGPSTLVCYLASFNVVNGTYRDLTFATPSLTMGTTFCGDWIAHTLFQNIASTDANLVCADVAFLYDVTFDKIKCNGGTGGSAGLSFIFDSPNKAQNLTGVTYTDTVGVNIVNSDVTGYNSGASINSGSRYTLKGNNWHENVGQPATIAGFGVLIHDNDNIADGGVHPSNIVVSDQFNANGNTGASGGGDFALAWNGAIATGTLDTISLVGSNFANYVGSPSYQINAATTHHSNLLVQGNNGIASTAISISVPASGTDRIDIPQSWTPALKLGGGATGMTYTSRGGGYMISGRQLTAQFNMLLSAKGSSTGAATITGLPYAITASANCAATIQKYVFAGSLVPGILIDASASTMQLTAAGAASTAFLADTDITNSTEIDGTLTCQLP